MLTSGRRSNRRTPGSCSTGGRSSKRRFRPLKSTVGANGAAPKKPNARRGRREPPIPNPTPTPYQIRYLIPTQIPYPIRYRIPTQIPYLIPTPIPYQIRLNPMAERLKRQAEPLSRAQVGTGSQEPVNRAGGAAGGHEARE